MSFVAVGISHKSAPLEIRERLVFANERQDEALHSLMQGRIVKEVALVSTCNRTEIYCTHAQVPSLFEWWSKWQALEFDAFEPYLYQYQGEKAIKHVMRVASGLDSMVLGEPQVLGQLKQAYHRANTQGALGHSLNRLFQTSFQVAKQIRTQTAIGLQSVSVAYTAVRLCRQIFSDISKQSVLCIGAGETIALCARHLIEQGVKTLYLCNRSLERGQLLAQELSKITPHLDIQVFDLSQLSEVLPKSDIVISSTASLVPILGKGRVETTIKQRKHKPMVMIDLAVPRDIEPEVSELDDVYLYCVDDLQDIILQNQHSRLEAAIEAEKIISQKASDFMLWHQQLKVVPKIAKIRNNVCKIKEEVLQESKLRLLTGQAPEQVLQWALTRMTNKLMHEPTIMLKEQCKDEKSILLIEELFKN